MVLKKIYKSLILVCLCVFICCTNKNTNKLSIMKDYECEEIIIEDNYPSHKVSVITNDSVKSQILNILHKKSHFELCKIPPNMVVTIKTRTHYEKFIICGNYIKNKGKTYKYPIDIENELSKIRAIYESDNINKKY